MVRRDNQGYSWINFKIDKMLHTKFSMILKFSDKRIREVMTALVRQYVEENHDSIMEIVSSPMGKQDNTEGAVN